MIINTVLTDLTSCWSLDLCFDDLRVMKVKLKLKKYEQRNNV